MKKYENENGTFKCLICLKVFSKQSKAELVCQVCKKKFPYKSLLNRHVKSHEWANRSFSNRMFDNSISDELFIPSQLYVSSYSQLNEDEQVAPGDDTYADFGLSSVHITENTVEIFGETAEKVEETAMVNETAE